MGSKWQVHFGNNTQTRGKLAPSAKEFRSVPGQTVVEFLGCVSC